MDLREFEAKLLGVSDEKLGFMIDRCRRQGPEVAMPLLLEEMRRRNTARLLASSDFRSAPLRDPLDASGAETMLIPKGGLDLDSTAPSVNASPDLTLPPPGRSPEPDPEGRALPPSNPAGPIFSESMAPEGLRLPAPPEDLSGRAADLGSRSHFWTFHYQDYIEPEEGFDERPEGASFSVPESERSTLPSLWLRESPVRWNDTDERMPPQVIAPEQRAAMEEPAAVTMPAPALEIPPGFHAADTQDVIARDPHASNPVSPTEGSEGNPKDGASLAEVPNNNSEGPAVPTLGPRAGHASTFEEESPPHGASPFHWAMLLAFILALLFLLAWITSRRRE